MTSFNSKFFTCFLNCFFITCCSFAQKNEEELKQLILQRDSLFWKTYNSCDTASMADFFSKDIEFYHDMGGPSSGLTSLIETFGKNLCKPDFSFRLRREAVEGSSHVYPLKQNGVIYGAILTGEHVFYILEKGKPEQLDGLAKFTHLWILKDGSWKMTRVLSYDHGPATKENKQREIALSATTLSGYAGKYKGIQSGIVEIETGSNMLLLKTGDAKFQVYPEKENLFFSKERDLTFEFVKSGNVVTKMIVRENGKIVEELELVK
jgi:hypothetical protein